MLWAGKKRTSSAPESIGHTVRSQRSHHDELLQGAFPFPLLGKLLLLWTLRLHHLLPALRRAFDVPVQTAKFISETHHLGIDEGQANCCCDVVFFVSFISLSRYQKVTCVLAPWWRSTPSWTESRGGWYSCVQCWNVAGSPALACLSPYSAGAAEREGTHSQGRNTHSLKHWHTHTCTYTLEPGRLAVRWRSACLSQIVPCWYSWRWSRWHSL